MRGWAWVKQFEDGKAIADFTEATRINPKGVQAFHDLAWMYTACPNPVYRDGRKAFAAASRACQLTVWRDPAQIDILAAAYAACGDYDHAAEFEQRAIAQAGNRSPDLAAYRDRLKHYEEMRPNRNPPRR